MRATSSGGLETCGSPLPIAPPRYPAGLVAVCVSVGCERFSCSLLLSLLVLYLGEHGGLGGARAAGLVGYFVGGMYLMALLGGLLADRGLGPWGAGLAGAALAMAGYGTLMMEGTAALYAGLGLVAVGSGIYKASPQALTDRLYGPDDTSRDAGFGRLYIAVNIGAFLGPLLGAVVRAHEGFRGAFVVAALGMLGSHLSLALFVRRGRRARMRRPERQATARGGPGPWSSGALGLHCLMALPFAVAQLQTSSSLLLWARNHTERHLWGGEVPVSYFAAGPAVLIVLLSPMVARLFGWLRRHGREPGTAAKLQLGMLMTALAYVPLVAAALRLGRAATPSLVWLLLCLVGLAVGELLVSALGPALLTRHAPPHLRARWLSVWFLAIALGCLGAGKLGVLFALLPPAQYFALILLLPLTGAALGFMARR